MNLTLRMAEPKDCSTILNFIKELAQFEKLSHEVVATVEELNYNIFEKKYAEVIIAEVDGLPAGFALYFHNFSTFIGKPGIYLEDLYVSPNYRSQQIGMKLFQRIAQIASERQCARIDWAVLDWNVKAIQFYERLGAQSLGDWTTYRLNQTAINKLAMNGN